MPSRGENDDADVVVHLRLEKCLHQVALSYPEALTDVRATDWRCPDVQS
jgi:hypothetical protein